MVFNLIHWKKSDPPNAENRVDTFPKFKNSTYYALANILVFSRIVLLQVGKLDIGISMPVGR